MCSELATPLGALRTWLTCPELETATLVPRGSARELTGVTRLGFRTPAATVELVVGEIRPRLPAHMTVHGCRAALWRVSAHSQLSALRFGAEWPSPPPGADGTPDSGEGLDAFTWRIADSVLSLGTEDGEFLAARAQRHAGVPARMSAELTISTVQYTDAGLIVPFVGLGPQEVLEVHFIAAWAEGHTESPSTWFAVEQDHGYIVQVLEGTSLY